MMFELNTLTVDEYMSMREAVGWNALPYDQSKNSVENAKYTVAVRENDQLIAMGRILWDGGYIGYIADIAVVPEHQGKGLGKEVVNTLLKNLHKDIPSGWNVTVVLISAKGKESFYEKIGFVQRPTADRGPGMTFSLMGE